MGYAFQELSCSNSSSQLPCCAFGSFNVNSLTIAVPRFSQKRWSLTFPITTKTSVLHVSGQRQKERGYTILRCDPGGVLETSVPLEDTDVSSHPAMQDSKDRTTFQSLQSSEKAGELGDIRGVGISENLQQVDDKTPEIMHEGQGLLQQIRNIVLFAGPVLGIWMSGPIMSLIDTAVVGNSSSLELAALGPGTVFCDQVGYVFMFLSISTSNLIATSLARQDKNEAAHHLSRLLFIALVCGISMLILSSAFSTRILKAFVGQQNASLLPAACSYVQPRQSLRYR